MKKNKFSNLLEIPEGSKTQVDLSSPQRKPAPRTASLPKTQNGRKQSIKNGAEDEGMGVRDSKQVLKALISLKKGNFSVRLPLEWSGTEGKVSDVFNELAELMENSTSD